MRSGKHPSHSFATSRSIRRHCVPYWAADFRICSAPSSITRWVYFVNPYFKTASDSPQRFAVDHNPHLLDAITLVFDRTPPGRSLHQRLGGRSARSLPGGGAAVVANPRRAVQGRRVLPGRVGGHRGKPATGFTRRQSTPASSGGFAGVGSIPAALVRLWLARQVKIPQQTG